MDDMSTTASGSDPSDSRPDLCTDESSAQLLVLPSLRGAPPRLPVVDRDALSKDSDGSSPMPEALTISRIASGASGRSSDTHLFAWDRPDETLLLLDWDDTLFPTTSMGTGFVEPETLLPGQCEEPVDIKAHCDAIVALLRVAASACSVRIVTMATREWLQACFPMIMPDFGAFLSVLGVEIVIAREYTKPGVRGECRDRSQFLKTQAMSKVIKDFYSSPVQDGPQRKRSWKNIMSIGDSPAERLAFQDVCFRHQQRSRSGVWKDFRCKTLMLLEEPSLDELTQELQVITQWLPSLLQHDGDLDIEVDRQSMALMTVRGEALPLAGTEDDESELAGEGSPYSICRTPSD
jgi:hypothetical protein